MFVKHVINLSYFRNVFAKDWCKYQIQLLEHLISPVNTPNNCHETFCQNQSCAYKSTFLVKDHKQLSRTFPAKSALCALEHSKLKGGLEPQALEHSKRPSSRQ